MSHEKTHRVYMTRTYQDNPPMVNTSTAWQDRLKDHYESQGKRRPEYIIYSDLRGGRTAYSCTLMFDGEQYPARYWYGGDNDNNAREDAAEVAIKAIAVASAPAPTLPQPTIQEQAFSHQLPVQLVGGTASGGGGGGGGTSSSSGATRGHHSHQSSSGGRSSQNQQSGGTTITSGGTTNRNRSHHYSVSSANKDPLRTQRDWRRT